MNQTNTGQPTAIYIYALIAGIIGFWQSESIGTGIIFAAVCAAAIWIAQEERYNLILVKIQSALKTLYGWLKNRRLPEQEATKTEPYVICPGQDIESREYIVTDLQELGSFMVIGMTGSGKTSFVHSILHQLLCNSNPIDLRLTICDLKEGLDFRPYRRLPHLLDNCPVATTPTESERIIETLTEEMTRRAQLFKAIPADRFCNNLNDYHRLGASLNLPRLPRILAIVDEFQILTTKSAAALDGMINLAKTGRAFGISLLPATQLANVDAIPTALKSQMSSVFCGYLTNPSHYYKIMEIPKEHWEPFHAQGKIQGRFIANIGGEVNIIQSLYVTKRELEETARQWSENHTEPEWPKTIVNFPPELFNGDSATIKSTIRNLMEREKRGENILVKESEINELMQIVINNESKQWQGSDDEKRAMLVAWFAGFSEMPTLAEFQAKFGASQGTYYNWIPRLWDERL